MDSRTNDVAAQNLRHAMSAALFARDRLAFEPDPVQSTVLDPGTRRGILNCTRQWGKSTVIAVKAVHNAWFNDGSLTIVVSPCQRQSGEFLRKAAGFLDALGHPVRGDAAARDTLHLPNGSRIIGLPDVESNIRGYSAVSLLLIDEAARVTDEAYKAARPMLAAGNGACWLMSTPFGKRGFFWREWADAGAPWERFSVPANACPRISPEFLEEERQTLGDAWFRQEYLCEFVESKDQIFPDDLLDSALSNDIRTLP